MMTIEERLAQLERKNRRLTLALVLVVLTTGFFFTVCMWATRNVPNEVIARSFHVVDAEGKVIACLGVGEIGEPVLRLRHKLVGGTSALLMADGLRLYHNEHANSASLPADKFDLNENHSAMLTVGGGMPSLRLWDKNGKERATLLNCVLTLCDKDGKEIVSVGPGEGGGGSVDIFNVLGKRVATIQADKKNCGSVGLFDHNGELKNGLTGQ